MKIKLFTPALALVAAVLLSAAGCNAPAKTETTVAEAAKPDMAAIKAQIQAIETEWVKAYNENDIDKVMTFLADDAVVMGNGEPPKVGKAAIESSLRKSFAARKKGTTISFETEEVFGDGNTVTEIGKTIIRDASGAEVRHGNYIEVFEKRNGKYICIRDMSNDYPVPQ